MAINAGQDGAFWLAATHVILKERFHDQPTAAFTDYVKQYTDAPFLIELEETPRGFRAGQMLPAGRLCCITAARDPCT